MLYFETFKKLNDIVSGLNYYHYTNLSPFGSILTLKLVSFAAVFWDIQPRSFPFVFVVCLHSVEQTNHIIAKCKWCKISRKKACGPNNEGVLGFLSFVSGGTHATKNGLCSNAMIMTDGKKNVNECPKYKCFMCSLLCSANKWTNIFWKCLIVSANQGMKVSYRLRRKERQSELKQSYLIS